MNILECLHKISIDNIKLEIKTKDIIYKVKLINNKIVNREDKIIIIGKEERLKLIKDLQLNFLLI